MELRNIQIQSVFNRACSNKDRQKTVKQTQGSHQAHMQSGNWDYFQSLIPLLVLAGTATAQSCGHKAPSSAPAWRQMVPRLVQHLQVLQLQIRKNEVEVWYNADVYHAGVCLGSNALMLAVGRSQSQQCTINLFLKLTFEIGQVNHF